MLRNIAVFLLVVFTSVCLLAPGHVYAQSNTGTIKIFSEVRGIEIFLDEVSQGKDMAVLSNVEIGSHYVKAVKDGVTIFSDLVNVNPGATTTILIKDTGQVKEKILESKYKEQQEYKSKKLDILLSKSVQTEGTGYASSMYFPGYYSIFGSEWSRTSSIAYEVTDWKIIQGGVQEISDVQFAHIVKDENTLKRYQELMEANENKFNIGAIVSLIGLGALAGGFATTGDTQAILITIGIVGCVFGLGFMSTDVPMPRHFISPSEAAKMAYDYNQNLKARLGLPANYEPQ